MVINHLIRILELKTRYDFNFTKKSTHIFVSTCKISRLIDLCFSTKNKIPMLENLYTVLFSFLPIF